MHTNNTSVSPTIQLGGSTLCIDTVYTLASTERQAFTRLGSERGNTPVGSTRQI